METQTATSFPIFHLAFRSSSSEGMKRRQAGGGVKTGTTLATEGRGQKEVAVGAGVGGLNVVGVVPGVMTGRVNLSAPLTLDPLGAQQLTERVGGTRTVIGKTAGLVGVGLMIIVMTSDKPGIEPRNVMIAATEDRKSRTTVMTDGEHSRAMRATKECGATLD